MAAVNAAGAVGEAVLRVLREEGLAQRAKEVGHHWLEGLRQIQRRFPAIVADVRGVGLFIGVELRTATTPTATGHGSQEAEDGEEDEPASWEAAWLVNRLRGMEERLSDGRLVSGVLLSTDGPHCNVLKIKPPLCIARDEVDCVNRCLDRALTELAQQRRTAAP